jgi:quinoprotein glucose dehydrogenase
VDLLGQQRAHGRSSAADENWGHVYLPTENATGDYFGGTRPGTHLFSESVLALDARTGKRVWHFQVVHHGLWDYDLPAAPVLADITVNGRRIKALAQVSKQAFVYVLDRTNGKPVWPIEERPAPKGNVPGEWYSPTQPVRPSRRLRSAGRVRQGHHRLHAELKAEALKILSEYKYGPLYTPPSCSAAPTAEGHDLPTGTNGGADWGGARSTRRRTSSTCPRRTCPTCSRSASRCTPSPRCRS